jgi:hypothetical protein
LLQQLMTLKKEVSGFTQQIWTDRIGAKPISAALLLLLWAQRVTA